MSDDLLAFLRARLDEDERVAMACADREWELDGGSIISGHPTNEVVEWPYDNNGPHIARHDPARVLREVEAKRRILDEHSYRDNGGGPFCDLCVYDSVPNEPGGYCTTVKALGLSYADDPDYRDEWKP